LIHTPLITSAIETGHIFLNRFSIGKLLPGDSSVAAASLGFFYVTAQLDRRFGLPLFDKQMRPDV
jgi:hypothetical protein